MTLWNNESDLREFAKSGAHLAAMKKNRSQTAKEIRAITIETDTLPNWKEAMRLLEEGNVITS